MRLCRENIGKIGNTQVQTPVAGYFDLPEKVLQFGTGVLLRGLPDYYIDKANKQNVFNGRIVVVKSTSSNGVDVFNEQDGLYTQCLRGIDKGKKIEENVINASVSRILSAAREWDKVLECATANELQVIISNTTEIGITLIRDNIQASPPVSFPGKLLAFLYRRYQYYNGDISKGMIIIPTELIPDNGNTLKMILQQLADQNGLETGFKDWLQGANIFCNSLVDRIVPGKLSPAAAAELEGHLGYRDEQMIMSETYGLWAIEAKEEKVKQVLSFYTCDDGVVITPDISVFRELKLRLLNGSHTFTCGLAFMAGFKTVKQAMENKVFEAFISKLMMNEIAPSITNAELTLENAREFASKVLDRYRNPFIEHQWINITLQYTSKMVMRNLPLLKKYIERNETVPGLMSLGLAAWLLFMKCEKEPDGKFYGEHNGHTYQVNDDHAALLSEKWKANPVDQLAAAVLSDTGIWQEDISLLPGLTGAVNRNLQALIGSGPMEMMSKFLQESKLTAGETG